MNGFIAGAIKKNLVCFLVLYRYGHAREKNITSITNKTLLVMISQSCKKCLDDFDWTYSSISKHPFNLDTTYGSPEDWSSSFYECDAPDNNVVKENILKRFKYVVGLEGSGCRYNLNPRTMDPPCKPGTDFSKLNGYYVAQDEPSAVMTWFNNNFDRIKAMVCPPAPPTAPRGALASGVAINEEEEQASGKKIAETPKQWFDLS